VAHNGSEIVGCVIGIIESYLKYSHFLSDITLILDKEYQNSLVGIKLITNAIQYAFNEYKDLKYISTEVHSINKASIRIIKKVGFKEEYTIPKKVLLSDGKYCDKVGLILDRESYKWQRNS
jgi:RimJ/RimL family protein N-acetyltransferase